MSKLQRYFLTGLLIVLPVFITAYALFVIFHFIDGICGNLINAYLRKHTGISIPGIGIILGTAIVAVIGFAATHLLGKRLLPAIEKWFLKFPFVRQIYPSVKQIVGFFVSKDKPAFKKVVLVEYPSKGIWSVGFVTNDSFKEARDKLGKELLHILIATTPSPWSGFLIIVPKDDVVFLDLSVEEAFKLIVSGGIIKP